MINVHISPIVGLHSTHVNPMILGKTIIAEKNTPTQLLWCVGVFL